MIMKKECTDVFHRVEGDEVIEFRCLQPLINPITHHHLWDEYQRLKRCKTKLNGFRCDIWFGHGDSCFSGELFRLLSGTKDDLSAVQYKDGKLF